MLFYSWVAGAGRGPACVLTEKHPLGMLPSAAARTAVTAGASLLCSTDEHWQSASRQTVKSGAGSVGFSTHSVSSSPKEVVYYIESKVLAKVRQELARKDSSSKGSGVEKFAAFSRDLNKATFQSIRRR